MTESPASLIIGGIAFLRDEANPTHFFYYPAEPSLARHIDGTPQLSWLRPASALLVTTQWAIEPQAQNVLSDIATFTRNNISFTPATALVSEVSVELSDGQGGYRQIASARDSSGYAPYQATFRAKLDPEQAATVETALAAGRSIPLRMTYHATLQLTRFAEASCSVVGDLTEDARALKAKFIVMDQDCRTRITDALAARRLSMECTSTANAPQQLQLEARDKAAEGAATKLRELVEQMNRAGADENVGRFVLKAEPGNVFTCNTSRTTTLPIAVHGFAGT